MDAWRPIYQIVLSSPNRYAPNFDCLWQKPNLCTRQHMCLPYNFQKLLDLCIGDCTCHVQRYVSFHTMHHAQSWTPSLFRCSGNQQCRLDSRHSFTSRILPQADIFPESPSLGSSRTTFRTSELICSESLIPASQSTVCQDHGKDSPTACRASTPIDCGVSGDTYETAKIPWIP
jgi:hypothetical protein